MTDNLFKKVNMEHYNPESNIFMTTVYISEAGSMADITNERLVVSKDNVVIFSVPCIKFEQVVIMGNITLNQRFTAYCLEKEIPVIFLSVNGNYKGRLMSNGIKEVKVIQYQLAGIANSQFTLRNAKSFIAGKLRNYAFMIKQLIPYYDNEAEKLIKMSVDLYKAKNLDELRGHEGAGAALYFSVLKQEFEHLGFKKRVKRPPTDMVNGLLSFGYTILYSNVISILLVNHINPYIGIFHSMDSNHASLASDLMEEFRAMAVDRTVISMLKTNSFTTEDFLIAESGGFYLTRDAKRKFIMSLEKGFNELYYHQESDTRVSLKKLIDLQSKQLYKVLKRETKDYIPMLFERTKKL